MTRYRTWEGSTNVSIPAMHLPSTVCVCGGDNQVTRLRVLDDLFDAREVRLGQLAW